MKDENLDLLQNLEACVVESWRACPEMNDHAVLRAYEAAFQHYRAESRGRPAKPAMLTGPEASLFTALLAICEFRLGRTGAQVAGGEMLPPVPLERILDSLRELSKSVARHTKLGGTQGYLNFIARFLP